MIQHNLLQKTELRIEHISLRNANLNDIAAVVATVMGMDRNEVLVTDLQNNIMTIDILKENIDAYNIVGKKDLLLRQLAALPGVSISAETTVCSEGMLGWIAFEEMEAAEALQRSEKMAEEIKQRLSKRAVVFSTGLEVVGGQIEDTNKPAISNRLEAEGYSVVHGPTLKDDMSLIAGNLRQAIDNGGYGLIVITGGVGAERKDKTIEAVQILDPDAAVPYICRFEKGTGRHTKDGVRIGVAEIADTLIIALPGPNDEVRSSLDVLVSGLKSNLNKHDLAREIAENLKIDLQNKMHH